MKPITSLIIMMYSLMFHSDSFPLSHADFVNKIVSGGKCNTFGYDQYVQNTDATTAYTVTVKVVYYKPGEGSKESQKVVAVPAGGKTYVGCSAGVEASVTYTYTVIGESK